MSQGAYRRAAVAPPETVSCPYCQQPAQLVGGDHVYPHRPDLAAKKFYVCTPCDARVGCHPPASSPRGGVGDGTVPLGRLANRALREARSAAHAAFDPLHLAGGLSRRQAYRWLAAQMGMQPADCHIAQMNEEQCWKVVAAVSRRA